MADILAFLAGRALAEAEGVDSDRATQLGLLPALMGGTSQSLLLTYFIARKEAEESQPFGTHEREEHSGQPTETVQAVQVKK